MKFIRKTLLGLAVAASATAAVAATAWPTRSVRLVVPFAAGGSMDGVARIIAPRLSEHLGQQVVIDNRAGADSLIGTQGVARSPADGYMLLMQGPTMLVNRAMQPTLWPDLHKELTFIAPVASTPLFLITGPHLAASSFKELVALAKGTKRQLDFASGSATTMFAEKLMAQAAGYETMPVPFKGSTAALTAVIGGDAAYSLDTLSAIRGFVDSGRVQVLATTGAERSPALPKVPTLAESGLAGFQFVSWWGLMGPAALPPEIGAKLAAALDKVMAEPEVKAKLDGIGADIMRMSPAAFTAFTLKEQERFSELARQKNLQLKN